MCSHDLPACTYVPLDSLGLQLKTGVSCPVGPGNQAQVLWKNTHPVFLTAGPSLQPLSCHILEILYWFWRKLFQLKNWQKKNVRKRFLPRHPNTTNVDHQLSVISSCIVRKKKCMSYALFLLLWLKKKNHHQKQLGMEVFISVYSFTS